MTKLTDVAKVLGPHTLHSITTKFEDGTAMCSSVMVHFLSEIS